MPDFAVNFLDAYTDESLLDEIRRVASVQHPGSSLSVDTFDRLSGRVSASTITQRFRGWREALAKAGLKHLYSGPKVSEKMKDQPGKRLTNDDLIAELKRVHAVLGTETMSQELFNAHSVTSVAVIRSRFGWYEALKIAGIKPTPTASWKWTNDQCLENLAAVWTHYGRQPTRREMFEPPSKFSGRAYARWGTWRKALRTFVLWANSENDSTVKCEPPEASAPAEQMIETRIRCAEEDRHEIPLRLKWRVHVRDSFRCVACGKNPPQHGVTLHADHIKPWADGGKTVLENLQTLCEPCNLGKGRSYGKVI
jgi:hypothetical protein